MYVYCENNFKTGYAQQNVNTSSSIWPTQVTKQQKLGVYAIEYTVESPNWTGKLHTLVLGEILCASHSLLYLGVVSCIKENDDVAI